jgi:hypothetical protein
MFEAELQAWDLNKGRTGVSTSMISVMDRVNGLRLGFLSLVIYHARKVVTVLVDDIDQSHK